MKRLLVTSWNPHITAQRLRRRRLRVALAYVIAICIAGSIVLDHVLGSAPHGDDWSDFDGQQFAVVCADDGQTISVRRDGSDQVTRVRLLGIRGSDGQWAEKSKEFLASLAGRTVTLKLEPTQTRDELGRLLASAFLDDRQPISVEVIDRGLSRADRRLRYTFHSDVERAQSEARKKQRGLWADY
jgi:endonuclease YncB( thermonuclease family)